MSWYEQSGNVNNQIGLSKDVCFTIKQDNKDLDRNIKTNGRKRNNETAMEEEKPKPAPKKPKSVTPKEKDPKKVTRTNFI